MVLTILYIFAFSVFYVNMHCFYFIYFHFNRICDNKVYVKSYFNCQSTAYCDIFFAVFCVSFWFSWSSVFEDILHRQLMLIKNQLINSDVQHLYNLCWNNKVPVIWNVYCLENNINLSSTENKQIYKNCCLDLDKWCISSSKKHCNY